MSQLKSSEMKVLELSLVFTLSRLDTTTGNLFQRFFITTTMRFGSISDVNKRKFTFETSIIIFCCLNGGQTGDQGHFCIPR